MDTGQAQLADNHWSGFGGILLALPPVIINHDIYSHYFHSLFAGNMPGMVYFERQPTLTRFLLYMTGSINPVLAFFPMVLGITWTIIYWHQYRLNWDWPEQIPLLLLVSLCTTPYGWMHDQVILLPALMQVAVSVVKGKANNSILIAYVAVNLTAGIVKVATTGEFWLFWTAPSFFLLYLAVKRKPIGLENQVRSAMVT